MKKSVFIVLAIALFSCGDNKSSGDQSGVKNLDQKELQYYSNGKKLYETYCTNCHTDQGEGLGRLIPPLKSSDYLMADLDRAARIIKYGQRGPITVNEIDFNQPMPANPQLTNLEIAEIVTYISNSWGNSAKGMTIDRVENALKSDQ